MSGSLGVALLALLGNRPIVLLFICTIPLSVLLMIRKIEASMVRDFICVGPGGSVIVTGLISRCGGSVGRIGIFSWSPKISSRFRYGELQVILEDVPSSDNSSVLFSLSVSFDFS